jgi:CDP-diglyceride synthetase
MGEHAGLLGGSLFGSGVPAVPYLSPKKSWAGFIGNLFMSAVVSLGLQHYWAEQLPFADTDYLVRRYV